MSYIFSFLMDYQMKLLVENGVHRLKAIKKVQNVYVWWELGHCETSEILSTVQ